MPTEFSAVFAKPILRVGGTLLAIGLRIKGTKQREHLRDDAQSLGPQAGMQLHVDVGVEDHPAPLSPHKIHVGHPLSNVSSRNGAYGHTCNALP